jgi:allophanate hydrolase
MYELPPAGSLPKRPGMVRVGQGGAAFDLEVWELPVARFGDFMQKISPPLAIGTVELDDGSAVKGFVCEAHAADTAKDISERGGWRAWLSWQTGGRSVCPRTPAGRP